MKIRLLYRIRQREWQKWFVWYPVFIKDAGSGCPYFVFLDTVERIKKADDTFEYIV